MIKISSNNPLRLLIIALALLIPLSGQSATNVSGNVFGTWTAAGSPYLVMNVIQVAGGQTLTIEPGVEVIFQGFYRFIINGQLKVKGNAAQPVVFKINDTTGWHNDAINSGGWRGIQFNDFQGPGLDSSIIQHAIIQDVKHGMTANANGINTLYVSNRALRISNTEFWHNQSSYNTSDGQIIQFYCGNNQEVIMDSCRVHHNKVRVSVIRLNTGKGIFRNNEWDNNQGGATFFGLLCEALLENNNIHHNTHIYDMSAIRIDGKKNIVRNNKIHHNTSDRLGAIMCTMGKTTIEQNLICNNQTLQGNCGPTDGGGGIHISHNNNAIWDSTHYIVRNNVIANNHCAFNGGGVYVYNCKADILNNHFVNNTAQYAGSGFYNIGTQSRLNIKNNLFYKNGNPNGPSVNQAYLLSCDSLWFDYNWGQYPLYNQLLLTNLAPTYIGDTSHRVVAANPFLVNPTQQTGLNDDATLRDFNLTAQSISCFNQGLYNAGPVGNTDFLGNNRLQGSNIDLGAFEYPVSIADNIYNQALQQVLIYPNPAHNQLIIDAPTSESIELQLLSLQGQCLLKTQFNHQVTLDLQKIPAGNYLLQLSTSNRTYRYQTITVRH